MADPEDLDDESEELEDEETDEGESKRAKGLNNLLKRHRNDAVALSATLYSENQLQRSRRRQLEKQLKSLRDQVPPEGAIILTGDQLKLWESYQALGTPETISTIVGERDNLKNQVESQSYRLVVASAAGALGYNEKVLDTLAQKDKLIFSLKEEKDEEGNPIEVPHVKTEGAAETKRLIDYASENWAVFLPSLLTSGSYDSPPAAPKGTQIISQGDTKSAPPKGSDPAKAYITRRYGSKK